MSYDDATRRLARLLQQRADATMTSGAASVSQEAQRGVDAHATRIDNPHAVTAAQAGAEPDLGTPAADDYVLSSSAAGVRAWVPQSGGGGGALTIEELDGSPSVAATKLVLPNGTLSVTGTEATYTPTGGGGATISSGAYASLPAAGTAGDVYLPTDSPYLFRDNGATWDAWGPIRRLTPPPTTGWSWVNQGAATVADAGGGIFLSTAAVSSQNRIRTRALAATPYTLTASLLPLVGIGTNNLCGVGIRQSSDGKLILFSVGGGGSGGESIFISRFSSPNAFVSAALNNTYIWSQMYPPTLRIVNNATNRLYQITADGVNFVTLATTAHNDYLVEDELVFFVRSDDNSSSATLVSWVVA
jgi:hypothetical protein